LNSPLILHSNDVNLVFTELAINYDPHIYADVHLAKMCVSLNAVDKMKK